MGLFDFVDELGAWALDIVGPSGRREFAHRAVQQGQRDAVTAGVGLPRGRTDSRLQILESFLSVGDFRKAKSLARDLAANNPGLGFAAWMAIQHFAIAMRNNNEAIEAAEEAEACFADLQTIPPSVRGVGQPLIW